jgi:hypothetical protein
LHGRNVRGLNIVLKLSDLLLEVLKGNELILDDKSDLELADTITDSDELGSAPDETFHLDGANRLLELLHIGFIVPRFDLEGDDGLLEEMRSTIAQYNMRKRTFAIVFGLFAFLAL